MNYITITTPDNIEIKYRLAGAGSRIGATIIDMAVQTLTFVIMLLVMLVLFFDNNIINIEAYNMQSAAVAFVIIAVLVVYLGYFIISEMLTCGQSIGKKIFRLRVMRENGMPVSLFYSIIRNVFRIFIDMSGIGIVAIMFTKTNKRIGDILASTIVVAEAPNQLIVEELTLGESNLTMMMQSENLKLANDEFYLIKEYFIREETFTDGGELALNAIKEYLANKFSVSSEKLSRDIIYKILELNNK